jgi:hypothetical protein
MTNATKIAAIGVCVAVSVAAAATPASAISLELAKKCRTLALKAHPYKLPGEKGPGSAVAERDYYNQCVTKGGNMGEENSSTGRSGGASGTGSKAAPAASPPQ